MADPYEQAFAELGQALVDLDGDGRPDVHLAPGYQVKNVGESRSIPAIFGPDGRFVTEVGAFNTAQADAERRLSRARPGTRPDLVEAVNSYRRAIGQPGVEMPRGAVETASIPTAAAPTARVAPASALPQHLIPTDPAQRTASAPVPPITPTYADYGYGVANAILGGLPKAAADVSNPDEVTRWDRGTEAVGRFGRDLSDLFWGQGRTQAMGEAGQLTGVIAGILGRTATTGREADRVSDYARNFSPWDPPRVRVSAGSAPMPPASTTMPESRLSELLTRQPTEATAKTAVSSERTPAVAVSGRSQAETAAKPSGAEAAASAAPSGQADQSLLRLFSREASDAPAMDMATFLDALRRGPRSGDPMEVMPPPPRQVAPSAVEQLPAVTAGKEGGAARTAAKAARTRSADDLRRALQDDLVSGGHAVPNAEVVDEVLRVMRSRTADAGAKRDEVLAVLKQHYPEAKMSDLRRALVRTKPYLDDAAGDTEKARDMIERRRATGVKTYAIPAAIGAGAMAQEDNPLLSLFGGAP